MNRRITGGTVVVHLVLFFSAAHAASVAAESQGKPGQAANQAAVLRQTLAIAEKYDSFKAAAYLEKQGRPAAVAGYYSALVRTLYFQQKNVPLMVLFGRAGIRYALDEAQKVEANDPETAKALRATAKTIAYNVGANTWPGWQDAGIEITKSDLVAGMDAARLNLRLAGELNRDAHVFANAHWLCGAHLLAAGKHEAAVDSFTESAKRAREANKPEAELMADGYVAIAKLAKKPDDGEAEKSLQKAMAALTQNGSDDAKFFAAQLRKVADFVVKRH